MEFNVLELFSSIRRNPKHLQLAKEALAIYSSEHLMPSTAAGVIRFFQPLEWRSPFFIMVDELGMSGYGRALTFLATTADGKQRRVLFIRWSGRVHNSNQLRDDLELVVEFIHDQRKTRLLLGFVCDASSTNIILRNLRLPTLYDKMHLRKRLASTYEHVENNLEEAYLEVFEKGSFRAAIQGYLARNEQDPTVGGDIQALLAREYTIMGELLEAKFRLSASPFRFSWATNDYLELLAVSWAHQWESMMGALQELQPALLQPEQSDQLRLVKIKVLAMLGYLVNNS